VPVWAGDAQTVGRLKIKSSAAIGRKRTNVESWDNSIHTEKRKFRLCEHPWLSLLAVMATSAFSMALSGAVIFGLLGLPDDLPTVQFVQGISYHILTAFIFAPFVLRLPKGKRTFRQYLDDIGLSRMRPIVRLALLALSCYVILALSQAAASFVYRLFEGRPINGDFVRQVFNLSGDLPPDSPSLLVSIPSIFEEVAFRGIALTVFLSKYSERKSIIFSSLGFGLMHLLNLAIGRELVWVMGQVVWAFTIGLFYGYVFVRTQSLLPSMIVHYLGNVFIGSLTGYMQSRASIEIQALYGIILSLGVVPATLMILWTRFFSSKWLLGGDDRV
jgi:membrane protease YdiL (CAAX protease family)